jgi:hypothetical protein
MSRVFQRGSVIRTYVSCVVVGLPEPSVTSLGEEA